MATTYTQADLDALDQAIATGAQTVAYADGKRVTYRSLADMYATRGQIVACLTSPIPGPLRKVAAHSKGVRPTDLGRFDFTR